MPLSSTKMILSLRLPSKPAVNPLFLDYGQRLPLQFSQAHEYLSCRLPSPTSWSKPAEPQAYPLPPLSRPASSCHPSRLATANRRNTSDSRSGSATIPHEGAQLHPPRVVKSADAAVPLQPEGSADTSGWGSKTTQALFKARQRTMVKTKRMRRR
jgi:hypothetical protein